METGSLGKVQVRYKEKDVPSLGEGGRLKKTLVLVIEAHPDLLLPPVKNGQSYLLKNHRGDILVMKIGTIDGVEIIPEVFLMKTLLAKGTTLVCDVFPVFPTVDKYC